ncbi:DUF3048 domain-containing protein [Luteimicrobium subarcticum]|uniref:DUF3048 family protein n=1 Tax=Luteimicrobium subarcticum TaxID=620910 RepID=A0A2M8WVQ5_9MICO|nr:DUF3048 domain-containing protein [Luteimicrobium subarcticum]PJI95009.1 Protein of unknown function (DUF3048) [Luteimicrobium subarcticum]
MPTGALTILGVLLVVAGCSAHGDPAPTATLAETAGPVVTPTPTPTPTRKPVVWPLTGMPATRVADRPALGIKVENSTDARPQTGLEQADMVWEEVVEGGITRFLAVYQSKEAERVEPVRSVRPMDPNIVAPLHGVLAFSGGQRPFVQAVGASGTQVLSMDGGSAGFLRDPTRYAPHNVYVGTKDLWAQADDDRTSPPPQQLRFAGAASEATAVEDGTPGTKAAIRMSPAYQPGWTYSTKTRTYLRDERGVPSVSTAGVRLSATNVVVLRVDVVNTTYKDPAGNPVPETEVIGSGHAIVLTGGKALSVTWSKKDQKSVLHVRAGGKDVLLAPGQTWIELVPSSTGDVTVS